MIDVVMLVKTNKKMAKNLARARKFASELNRWQKMTTEGKRERMRERAEDYRQSTRMRGTDNGEHQG